jgi:hypothetical protein
MSGELPAEKPISASAMRPILFNILSIFFLALSCLCPAFSLMIFAAPNSALNPLPPNRGAASAKLPTPTATPIIQFPTQWTPTLTPMTPVATTHVPAGTEEPTQTPVFNPNPGTPKPFSPFVVEGGNPAYSASPNGCSWLGVAGAVYDLSHAPLNNLFVQVHGTLSGNPIDMEQITGALSDGQKGDFEFQLADKPILSLNLLWIQLLDGSRTPISDKIVFNTYAACDKNLITINFIQVNP